MIDENLIKDVAKKYDLNVKCERDMSIYIVMLDDKEICYYSTLRAGWVQVSTQVTVDWCFLISQQFYSVINNQCEMKKSS